MENQINQIVVDTDIIVDYLRKVDPQASVFKRLFLEDQVLFTSISAYELRVGSEQTKRQANLKLLFQPRNTLPLDLASAIEAGKILTELRAKGEEISPGDILISGICLSNNLPVLTRNEGHFKRVPKLKVMTIHDFE
jgi:predicted nucleic acid-binding protein